VELAATRGASWVVVDGYRFGIEYQKTLKAGGLKSLVIDDTGHAGAYAADLVLDQNAHASDKLYQHREPYTRLLLGSRYALLRREFTPWRAWKREIAPSGRKVLVTMGGSDPQNQTILAIRALQRVQVDGFESRVIIGGSNPHFDELQAAAGRGSRSMCLVRNATNMPDLMAWADVAFAAAGSAAWELAFMGLPTIFTVSAEHQNPIAEAARIEGVGVNFGGLTESDELKTANSIRDLLLDASRRETMAVNGRRLVDGVGAERVVSILTGNGEVATNTQS
jgi:UDP-2,4-diacetamido-2,4,6-trideoxy-beta-L-altropyranose hydrolase